MIKVFTEYMIGPVGRAIEALYLHNAFIASMIVLGWMIVVLVGMQGATRMRVQLRQWIRELLLQYDLDDRRTPERMLQALEPRWNEAAAQVRFMPTKHGLWTQRATPDGLRRHAGFTPEGIDRTITSITGRQPDTRANGQPATTTARAARKKKRMGARAYR
jgi:hypothetical protein